MIGKFFKCATLAFVFITGALFCGVVAESWLGIDAKAVWFVFGGAFNDVAGKFDK